MQLSNSQLEALRIERGKRNLSIASLSKEIGISRVTTGSIINGRTDGLSRNTFNKIASWLKQNKKTSL